MANELTVRTCACGCGLAVTPKSRFRRGHNVGIGGASGMKRFLKFVDIKGDNDCWEWQHTISASGYGQLRFKRKMMQAHRFSYELHRGPIPAGLLVCHTCDNKRCVNPAHLFLGSHYDNAVDMIRKDRHARYAHVGEKNPIAKLNAGEVREIRRLRKEGLTQQDIADRFGLCRQHVGDIVNRKIWKQVKD